MLKNKRVNKKQTKKEKEKTKENMKDDDFEINSESSLDSEEIDRLQKNEGEKKKKEVQNELFKKGMSNDDKRLLMAKTLIKSIEDKNEDFDNQLKIAKNDICNEKSKFLIRNHESPSFIKCHLSTITSINFIDDYKIVTTSKDNRSFIIDLITQKKHLLPQFTDKPIITSQITKDGRNILFGGNDKKIYLLNLDTEKIISVLPKAHNDTITSIKIDPSNEQIYSVSKDNNMKVWALNDYNNLIHMETFYGHTNHIWDMDVLNTNRVVTCGNDSNIHQWRIDSQSFLQYKQGSAIYDCISAVNKNYFYSGDYEGKLKLFNVDKKKQIADIINSSLYGDTSYHRPIISLHSIKNSDLVFTGGLNGEIIAYKTNYSKLVNHIDLIGKVNTSSNNGIISCMSTNKNLLVYGLSKDSKNGRWDTDYDLKSIGIGIVNIFE